MRKFRYTTGTKIWLVILQQIFAVLLVVSIVLLSALFDRRMLNTNDILDTSFVNSGYYTDMYRHGIICSYGIFIPDIFIDLID